MPARSSVAIDVVNAVRAPVSAGYVRAVMRRASTLPEVAARLPEGRSTVAVRLTDDDELRLLNQDFSRKDRTTDVLAFEGAGDHLGDLAISWPAVVRQAASHGHPPPAELGLLSVHGLLHLLGWDHATAAQRREMTRVTVAALALSGVELSPDRL